MELRKAACLSQAQLIHTNAPTSSTLTSPIVTFTVGKEGRLFAAHEDVLAASPFFLAACRQQFLEDGNKRIDLPDEEPEIFSCVLEYLYVRLLSTSICQIQTDFLFAEGRLLPPLVAQQTPKLLGARGCSNLTQPRKHRWSRVY